jgi:hypothetical protein
MVSPQAQTFRRVGWRMRMGAMPFKDALNRCKAENHATGRLFEQTEWDFPTCFAHKVWMEGPARGYLPYSRANSNPGISSVGRQTSTRPFTLPEYRKLAAQSDRTGTLLARTFFPLSLGAADGALLATAVAAARTLRAD